MAALDQGVRGLRVAYSPDLGFAAVDPEVVEATSRAARVFEELGCTVDEPKLDLEDPSLVVGDIFAIGGSSTYGHLLDEHADELTDYGRRTIEYGRGKTAADYSRSLLGALRLQAQMADFFEKYDLLLTPTMAIPAFPIGQHPAVIGGREVDPTRMYISFTGIFNVTMQTAASVPCGFSSDGMPIGLHVIGRSGEETTVLRASAAFEEARPWANKRPPVS